jgi:hypothetical protein
MPSPLRAALVYFGLADDPRVRATATVARLVAVVVALCLGTALALVVLWLIGVHLTAGMVVAFAVCFGVAALVARLRD